MTQWILCEPSDGLRLLAETDGVWLRAHDGVNLGELRLFTPRGRLGRLLPTLIPQLLEMGLGASDGSGFRIDYPEFSGLKPERGIDAFEGIVPWAHWVLQLETAGIPGTSTFKYFYRFFAGSQAVYPDRLGCFVRRLGETYQLDHQTYALIEAIHAFNSLSSERKSRAVAFIRFAEVKGLAEEVGAQLDKFLLRERVVIPSEIALDIIPEEDGRISFAPKIDGVSTEAMRRAFLASDDAEEVYSLDDAEGGRVRVVLNDSQREVLRRMQRVRHLGGAEKAAVLRDPARVFDGVAGSVGFGPRVRGVGDFPFVARPFLQRSSTGIFDDPESACGRPERGRFSAGLKCEYADGSVDEIQFTSREQLYEFRGRISAARESGAGVIDFQGKSILVDSGLARGLDDLVARVTPSVERQEEKPAQPRRYVLIYTNEAELEYEERAPGGARGTAAELPKSLRPGVLKRHQFDGLGWLQRNYSAGLHGCLLADDMGLGKTLQVLAFLAWLIERGEISPEGANPEAAPWKPILVVTPLTLIEIETWADDMVKFFRDDGEVFRPWIALHGNQLKEFRREKGAETVIGEPVLDIERFHNLRLLLTNYETVVNYQHSFARVGKGWSVVVTDEAQEFKTPSTKVSHALKSLAPRFRIACTGTPVETRLRDLWNIFDFLQPGQLLGSAEDFSKRYEQPLEAEDVETRGNVIPQLRDRLRFGKENAFVLRRDKSTLPELPAKQEHVLECDLSPKQRDWHMDLVSRARSGEPGSHPFSLISQLMKVYQHPGLVPRYEPIPCSEAVEQCPKLKRVLDCLREIRERSEKALIFTRTLNMQQILSSVISAEFGIEVDIINGVTSRKGDTRHSRQTRKGIVRRFRETPGFGVLVLSPDVAGLGLTLVEANHVLHYGRWWNPAKESQATDRAYRIGQVKDVHVYYPIAKDPLGAFQTFDEKLDALITRRRQIASEFLAPMPGEDQLQEELLRDVLNEGGEASPGQRVTDEQLRTLPWDRFEALLALLEEKQGAHVLLTPRAGDDKADVIAVRGQQLRLVQCKHTTWEASIGADALAEILMALDTYLSRYLAPLRQGYALRLTVATNGSFTRAAQRQARERDIDLITLQELCAMLQRTPCTLGEVEAMEARRLATMRDLRVAIEQMGRQL
ncbi:MAG TPA: SNF2-related protein [Terriglobia bacterium]|nr:SNF2-related protein [Terriglobia bacterium]